MANMPLSWSSFCFSRWIMKAMQQATVGSQVCAPATSGSSSQKLSVFHSARQVFAVTLRSLRNKQSPGHENSEEPCTVQVAVTSVVSSSPSMQAQKAVRFALEETRMEATIRLVERLTTHKRMRIHRQTVEDPPFEDLVNGVLVQDLIFQRVLS